MIDITQVINPFCERIRLTNFDHAIIVAYWLHAVNRLFKEISLCQDFIKDGVLL